MVDRDATWLGLNPDAKPLVLSGLALGIGIGGFFDGIVFHQILQFHHMLSSHPDPTIAADIRLNVMADGIFHLATWLFTIVGVVLLSRAWRFHSVPNSGRALLGASIMGWGAFNLVEGLVNHHLLGLHHVWPDGPGPLLLWDGAFLLWGLLFLLGGYLLIRTDSAALPSPGEDSVAADGSG